MVGKPNPDPQLLRQPLLPEERPGQPGGKRDRNRREREEALIQAGLQLFLIRGTDIVTIDEIAKEAKTAKGNFYRYFREKSDLVRAIIQPIALEFRNAVDICEEALKKADDRESLGTAYNHLAITLIPVMVTHPQEVLLYLQECRGPAHGARAPIAELSAEVSRVAVHLTEIAAEHQLLRVPDPRVSAFAVIGAVEQLCLHFLRSQLALPPAEVALMLISLVLDGVRNR
jgi:AcrR family transcriptional regulator